MVSSNRFVANSALFRARVYIDIATSDKAKQVEAAIWIRIVVDPWREVAFATSYGYNMADMLPKANVPTFQCIFVGVATKMWPVDTIVSSVIIEIVSN